MLSSVFDAWTFGHIAFGVLLGLLRWQGGTLLAWALGWEWFEATSVEPLASHYLEIADPVLANSIVDVLVAWIGWAAVTLARIRRVGCPSPKP